MLRLCASFGSTYGFQFGKLLLLLKKRGTNQTSYIILPSKDVWESCFAHACFQIHFTLFCRKFTFVEIYELLGVKQFWMKPCLCKKNIFFHVFLESVTILGAEQDSTKPNGDGRMNIHTNERTKILKPSVGRPLLGPAKILIFGSF